MISFSTDSITAVYSSYLVSYERSFLIEVYTAGSEL